MSLEIKNLSISAGGFSLSDISLSIPKGECAVIMGKSGAGKTTLMESLCGLRSIDTGGVFLNGDRIDQLRPGERGIGLVPQDAALFPHMTVREHLEFSLKLQKWGAADVKYRSSDLAESLGLEALLNRKPINLSGGEQKRVAIGRAIAAKPKLLCLDEAFTGLDDEASRIVIAHLQEVTRKDRVTTISVTHRLAEAELMADCIYQLSNGSLSLTKSH